jgi:hypothetical protein
MDQMDSGAEAALTTSLNELYATLADADPLAAPPPFVVTGARALAETFEAAGDEGRARVLLRALDEAIAAVEIASMMAEVYTRPGDAPISAADVRDDALATAYAAFAASQSAYQSLYHYRNALAARLQLDAHLLPPAVAASPAAEEPQLPAH